MGTCCMKVKQTSPEVDDLFDASGTWKAELTAGFKLKRVVSDKGPLWDPLLDVLARSWAGTTDTAAEAVFNWCYDPSLTADTAEKPLTAAPTEARIGWFTWLAKICAYASLNRGSAYALVETSSNAVVAGLLCGPPGSSSTQTMGLCEKLSMAKVGDPPKGDTDGKVNARRAKIDALVAKLDKANTPKNPFLFVIMIGVDPKRQKQGLGKSIMQHACAIADADGAEAYLQTIGKGHENFYAKSGFAVAGRMTSAGPGAAGPLDFNGGIAGMVRPGGGGGGKLPAGNAVHPAPEE